MLRILLLVFLTKCCSAVIYNLNATEYNRMPQLFQLDEYEQCVAEPGGTYCVASVSLVPDDSDLMRIIQDYSADTLKHYNHSVIHRGVCITRTCKQFMKEYTNETELDLNRTLEACLNDSLWKEYKLQGKLAELQYCNTENDEVNIDALDIIMAVVYLVLITLNIVGTLYDVKKFDKDDNSGYPYLLAFSLRRNWNRLVAPVGGGKEPRLERLKLFHGMRTLTMVCVVFSHTVLILVLGFVNNPLYIEKSYEDPLKQLLFNGSLVTHTFFVMSSFLMAYNLQLYAEKHPITWKHWPKGVLMRWLRLTPTYALVLGAVVVGGRRARTGPLRSLWAGEAQACRRYWWAHLLYVNNYVYADAYCAPETWYLAADTQLFCLSLLVCAVWRGGRARAAALGALFAASLGAAAAHTYFQRLDAVVMQAPESYRNLYSHDDTFRLVYIRGHTNLSTYTLGLAGGFLTYYWQTEKKDYTRFKKYRFIIWLLVPAAIGVILSGGLFYADGARAPLAATVLYAALYKPLFQAMVLLFILGCVFKLESVYRSIVEWRGFTWTGRVSYSAYLLHTLYLRALVGSYPMAIHLTDYLVMALLCGALFMTYTSAVILWLTVEAPLAGVVKAMFEGKRERGESSKV